jgi:ribonuclease P protein component
LAASSSPDRLRSSADIRAVLRRGRRVAGRHVVVHARDTDHGVRGAVLATRRVGNAVRRNRAKRLMREAMRHASWRDGIDLVLVARASCADQRLAAVEADVTAAAQALADRVGS